MKLLVLWLTLLLYIVDLKYTICLKCSFVKYRDYTCEIEPDWSRIEEKHFYRYSDDDVKEIQFNGNNHKDLNLLDLSPFCERFRYLTRVFVDKAKLISESSFQQCTNLDTLVINAKEIEEIPEKLFYNQRNLTQIFFPNGKLRILPENVFLNQKKLQHLNLRWNQISCLPPNIFKSLSKLRFLNLNGNNIQSLNPKWFESLQLLNTLDLSYNKIQDLPKNIFTHMERLEELHISDNQLTRIHSDSFGIHENLQILDLKNNKIRAFDENLIDNIAVKWLYMGENICNDKNINASNDMKEQLRNCFNNYQPRGHSSKFKYY